MFHTRGRIQSLKIFLSFPWIILNDPGIQVVIQSKGGPIHFGVCEPDPSVWTIDIHWHIVEEMMVHMISKKVMQFDKVPMRVCREICKSNDVKNQVHIYIDGLKNNRNITIPRIPHKRSRIRIKRFHPHQVLNAQGSLVDTKKKPSASNWSRIL